MSKLREILGVLWKEAIIGTPPSDKLDKEKSIDLALSSIKSEILGEMPKEKSLEEYELGICDEYSCNDKARGFNECLAHVKKIVCEL